MSVYQGDVKQKSCGTLQLTYGLEQSDQIYTLLCNTEGDTVKLRKSTGAIAVYEVVVLGKGKSIKWSSSYDSSTEHKCHYLTPRDVYVLQGFNQ